MTVKDLGLLLLAAGSRRTVLVLDPEDEDADDGPRMVDVDSGEENDDGTTEVGGKWIIISKDALLGRSQVRRPCWKQQERESVKHRPQRQWQRKRQDAPCPDPVETS